MRRDNTMRADREGGGGGEVSAAGNLTEGHPRPEADGGMRADVVEGGAHQTPTRGRFEFCPRARPLQLGSDQLPVRGYAWQPSAAPAATMVLVHGLQSHARWFAEAADLLCDRALAVYALDRRGSGSSPMPRGEIGRYSEWFDEVDTIVDRARVDHPGIPVHLVGHCFGGAIALGCALRRPDRVASLVMLTPGLHVQPDYRPAEKLRILACALLSRDTHFRVPQDDDMFTRDPEVLAWIHGDVQGARTVTAGCLLQTARMMSWLRRGIVRLQVPLLVVEAGRDRIADNPSNRALLDRTLCGRWERLVFDAEHLLVAEPCRDDLLDALAGWARHAGRTRP
jgi:lysophospholipase